MLTNKGYNIVVYYDLYFYSMTTMAASYNGQYKCYLTLLAFIKYNNILYTNIFAIIFKLIYYILMAAYQFFPVTLADISLSNMVRRLDKQNACMHMSTQCMHT